MRGTGPDSHVAPSLEAGLEAYGQGLPLALTIDGSLTFRCSTAAVTEVAAATHG